MRICGVILVFSIFKSSLYSQFLSFTKWTFLVAQSRFLIIMQVKPLKTVHVKVEREGSVKTNTLPLAFWDIQIQYVSPGHSVTL